ncbi:hypothetical protein TNCV_3682231 [Trichonephila clavipes]|uniref:Uncharacterized protein n=1 Tax=Trichonephila clavipes TaxID=2585209 RepID=A0A8X6V1D8_TRICX|nr:hypothetical protein TNCV_3682231 [Trichonephila clavipes]
MKKHVVYATDFSILNLSLVTRTKPALAPPSRSIHTTPTRGYRASTDLPYVTPLHHGRIFRDTRGRYSDHEFVSRTTRLPRPSGGC